MTAKDPTPSAPRPWGVHRVPIDDEIRIDIGPLRLRFAQEAGEIRLAFTRDGKEPEGGPGVRPGAPEADGKEGGPEDPDDGPDDGPDEAVVWTRWAPADWTGEVSLAPAFPDRPLVVAPEDVYWLLAGAEARVYVRIPLWVRVDALGTTPTTLMSLPVVPASDTWWGSVEEGELCYWLETHARKRITEDLFTSWMAICPLQLVNRSGDDLRVEKIAVRVAYLSLYGHEGRSIWADETSVRYQGDLEGSRLEMSGKPPVEAPAAELLAPPRTRMAHGFRARTFARLRSLPGWM